MDLIELRCPHNWGLQNFNNIEDELLLKQESVEEDVEEFDTKYASQTSRFFLFSLLSFEEYRKEKYTEALECIEKANVTDDFMNKYERVFKHVYQASKAHILYKMNSIEKAIQMCIELQKETFSEVEEAGFKYVQCNYFSYFGKHGHKNSIELIESAIDVVKDEPEFHYIHAKLLCRVRHFQFPTPSPSEKEFDACSKAVSLRKDIALYSLQLARLYMDARYSASRDMKIKYSNFATSLFKNLLKNHGSLSGNDIARCVFNMVKVKFDPDLEEYVTIARKKSNSVIVNHYSGLFYVRNQQYEEALNCFDNVTLKLPYICGKTLLVMYRIHGNSLSDDDIEVEVSKWIQHYELGSSSDLYYLYMDISIFYLLVMNDIVKASSYFISAHSTGIMEKCLINITKKYNNVNYLVVLKNELTAVRNANGVEKANGVEDEALSILQKLPPKLHQANLRFKVPSLYELKEDLS